MQIKIEEQQAGKRLDRALSELLNCSRSFAAKLITTGNVTGQSTVKASSTVKVGEIYNVDKDLPLEKQSSHTNVDIKQQLIYEDENILVINKFTGQVVHPGPGQREGTIAAAVASYYPPIKNAQNYFKDAQQTIAAERAGIVHRLDKDTSGVLVIAKTKNALIELQQQFKDRIIKKVYTLVCSGVLDSQTINQPITRHSKYRFLRSVQAGGKNATTIIKTLKIEDSPAGQITLVEAYPKTGRTHQIRVHTKWAKHPILGDKLYNDKLSRRQTADLQIKRLMLHASSITIIDPKNRKPQTFIAPLPGEFSTVTHLPSFHLTS